MDKGTDAATPIATFIIHCLHCGRVIEERCKYGNLLFYSDPCSCGYYRERAGDEEVL